MVSRQPREALQPEAATASVTIRESGVCFGDPRAWPSTAGGLRMRLHPKAFTRKEFTVSQPPSNPQKPTAETDSERLFPHFDGFRSTPVLGSSEEGITRRDPSVVLSMAGRYHVWYSKNVAGRVQDHSGFTASIYHAASEDGHRWEETGEALPKGESGAWDDCGVFTPTVYCHGGRIWMLYTAMPEAWKTAQATTKGTIGLAVAESPQGPWSKLGPVIRCSDDPAAFDSLRVDDACVVLRQGRIWVYYKGRQWDRSPAQTKMGLAIADRPEGPYVKQPQNPVLDSGHEVCVWPHGPGVAAMVCAVGPQGNTLQYSPDGLRFQRVCSTEPPKAPGPYRADLSPGAAPSAEGAGITWGLGMVEPRWPYLVRFECDLRCPPSLLSG
jgi:hypothetical protein